MAQKTSEKGLNGAAAPVVTEPGRVRNVVLVGHSGAGKTTLVEALLAATGTIPRAGTVTDGTTVSDHDPAAQRQQRSVSLACARSSTRTSRSTYWTPPAMPTSSGSCAPACGPRTAALFVVSAVDGVDEATTALWEECASVGMPRAVAITRLDHPRADYDQTLQDCQESFGENVMPIYQPMLGDDGETVAGLLGLVTLRVLDYSQDTRRGPARPSASTSTRSPTTATRSSRDHRRERGRDPHGPLSGRRADQHRHPGARPGEGGGPGQFLPGHPGLLGDRRRPRRAAGRPVTGAPSPLEHDLPVVTGVDGSPRPPLACNPDGPLVAEVVKTTIDRHVGRVSLVRVFSGTLRPEQTLHVSGHGLAERGHPDHDADERVAHIYSPLGAQLREVGLCVAGDVCAITKSGSAETGDTLSGKDDPLLIQAWTMPEPLLRSPWSPRPAPTRTRSPKTWHG